MESKNKPQKIRNPFIELEGYHCFGCSPNNPFGLQMKFHTDGEEVVSIWKPQHQFQGYFRILHGGIQAALMDEIASWVVYVILKTAGYTSRAQVSYHHTVSLDNGPLTLRAKALQMRKNLADIEVALYDKEGKKCASGLFTYFTFSKEEAKITMYYPADNDFFEKEQ